MVGCYALRDRIQLPLCYLRQTLEEREVCRVRARINAVMSYSGSRPA